MTEYRAADLGAAAMPQRIAIVPEISAQYRRRILPPCSPPTGALRLRHLRQLAVVMRMKEALPVDPVLLQRHIKRSLPAPSCRARGHRGICILPVVITRLRNRC